MKKRAKLRAAIEAMESRLLLTTVYVDVNAPGPTHDGASWDTAFIDLQQGLAAAVSGDQIHVADGTYKPTSGTDRTISFQLKNGASLLGGYAGYGATDPDARSVSSYPTILSGDIGTPGDNTDNSYEVVVGISTDSTTILDGFTITAGMATGPLEQYCYGGGMLNNSGSPTISNCIFSGNTGLFGGGICNSYSSPTLTNCIFSENTGGGMYNSYSSPILTNCVIIQNTVYRGGGIYNTSSSPTLTNCIVWGCGTAPIYSSSSTPTVSYSDIEGGYSGVGNLDADPQFVRSPWAGPDGVLETADDDRGDLRLRVGSPASNAGSNSAIPAGITTDLAGNARIQDGIVDLGVYEGSVAVPPPKAIYVDVNAVGADSGTSWTDAFTNLLSAILAATDGDTIRIADGTYRPTAGPDQTLSFGLKNAVSLYGGYAGYGAADPNARNIVAWPTILSVDVGVTGFVVLNVLTAVGLGNATTLDGLTIGYADGMGMNPNMGSGLYAISSSPTLINCTFCGNNGGGMCGIDNSSPTLTNCTFSGNGHAGLSNSDNSSATLTNCTFSGNSRGGLSNSGNSSATLSNCTFSGNMASSVGAGMCNNGNSSAMLTNCTFIGNTVPSYSSSPVGGGMFNGYDSSATLTNCTFTGNTASYGGGLYNSSPSLTLTNCVFNGNTASSGGAIYNKYASSPTLTNCIFNGDTASTYGGGMYNYMSSPTLTNCTFNGNTASTCGGAMYNYDFSSPKLNNCALSGNMASTYGGAIYNYSSSSSKLSNCSLSGNTASTSGGAIYSYSSSSAKLSNCIVWSNGAIPFYDLAASTPTITYSDIQGGWTGVGNIDADPQFVRNPSPGIDGVWGTADDDYGDLRLQPTSPCIDAGNNAAVPSGVTTDLEGNPRFVNIPGVNDPGAIVDMGAYERQIASAVTSGAFVTNTAQPSIALTFSSQLSGASLAITDLVVRTVLADGSLGGAIPVSGCSYDPSTKTATFTLSSLLPDGNYRATLVAGCVSDTYGSNAPAVDYSLDFFVLAGDANHDRIVNFSDLLLVAQNYGQTGKTWTQGDFNYDGTINMADLLIVSQQYNNTLAAPAPVLQATTLTQAPAPAVVHPAKRTPFKVIGLIE